MYINQFFGLCVSGFGFRVPTGIVFLVPRLAKGRDKLHSQLGKIEVCMYVYMYVCMYSCHNIRPTYYERNNDIARPYRELIYPFYIFPVCSQCSFRR
jgi:hypothetical protein